MTVPAKKKFFGPERFDSLKEGESFSINSGMGGSFTVSFMGVNKNGLHVFRNDTPGWEKKYYWLTKEQLHEQLFILVPEEKY